MNGATERSREQADLDVIIAQFGFLAGVDRDELENLFQNAAFWEEFAPGDVFFQQDTRIDCIYILLRGRGEQFRIERGEDGKAQRTLMRLIYEGATPGVYDFLFGEQFDNRYRTTARATEACTVISLETATLNRLFYHYPEMRNDLAPMDLISRLRTIPLVGREDLVTLGFLADASEQRTYQPDSPVYAAGGQERNDMFLIDQGQVKIDWGDGFHSWLGTGAAFSPEMSRDVSPPLSHAATTETLTDLIVISRESFHDIVGWDPVERAREKADEREQALEELFEELFLEKGFSAEQRSLLAGFMSHYYFPTNSVLIQQGEQANSLWMLMEGGEAALHALDEKGSKLVTTISIGPTYFAETALLGEIPQDSTVEALAGSEWLRLYWRDFQDYDEAEPVDMRPLLRVKVKDGEIVTREGHRKRYPWLQRGELVILFSRRHWIAFLRKGIPAFIVFAGLVAVAIIGVTIQGYQWWIAFPAGILAVLALAFFIWGAIDYFNDWIVVTNRRVVHQEKVLFVNEWRKEAPLEQIQNVDFQTTFLGRWLNYGTMVIQTASTSGVISFDYTRHFKQLNAAISTQRRRRRKHTVAQSKKTIHHMLEKRLGLELVLPKQVYRGGRLREAAPGRSQESASAMDQETGDTIVWRRHLLVLLPKLWWALLILIFWLVVFLLPNAPGVSTSIPDSVHPLITVLRVVSLISLIVAFVRVSWVIANWHNDTYEVNDESLVHVEKLPLSIAENRKSASLGNIQNVEMYIRTPIQWLFNYGDVVCQTAAEEGDFTFNGVPAPRAVAEEILRRIERFRRQAEAAAVRRRSQDLPDWFEVYNTLEMEKLEQKPSK